METRVIYLIEDLVQDKDKIMSALGTLVKDYADAKSYSFQWLEGTASKEYKGKNYCFYEEERLLKTLEERYESNQNSGVKMGILLDIMLTLSDLKGYEENKYPSVELAKTIYFTYKDKIPVYIITANPFFETQSEMIMGENLSECYILKNDLTEYKIEEDIQAMLNFFK